MQNVNNLEITAVCKQPIYIVYNLYLSLIYKDFSSVVNLHTVIKPSIANPEVTSSNPGDYSSFFSGMRSMYDDVHILIYTETAHIIYSI